MAWTVRNSKKFGPFRLTASRQGLSGSVGAAGMRFRTSTSGRKGRSVRLGRGLFWRRG